MKTSLFLIVTLALTQIVCAEELPADAKRTAENAFKRELEQATDIAIVSPLPAGGYRVVSNLKGEQFAVSSGAAISLSGRIRDDLRKELQLLVWQGTNHPSVVQTDRHSPSLGAATVSAGGDVTLASGVKVSLIGLALKPHLIYVTSKGEQGGRGDGDKPSK